MHWFRNGNCDSNRVCQLNYLFIPLNLSDLLLKSSAVNKINTDNIIKQVATAKIVGLNCSLSPVHIWIGIVVLSIDNTTIPIQMWTGLREQLSPTILAVATCLIILSVLILLTAELLRRRSERLRGINR